MSKAFQDGIVFAKLLNVCEAGTIDMEGIVLNQEEGGISFRNKRANVKKAYDAALRLSLVSEEQFKAIDFVKGEEDAIQHFLIKANAKYNFRSLGEPAQAATVVEVDK